MARPRIKITINSPAVLGFAAVCLAAMGLNLLTNGKSNILLFSVYPASLLSPLTWLRFFTHVLGHADWEHLLSNMMYFLILGPMLEEKYGTSRLITVMLATALVTGVLLAARIVTVVSAAPFVTVATDSLLLVHVHAPFVPVLVAVPVSVNASSP